MKLINLLNSALSILPILLYLFHVLYMYFFIPLSYLYDRILYFILFYTFYYSRSLLLTKFLYILIFILGVQLRFRQIQSMTLEVWIFGLAVDVEEWPGTPHDFLRLRLS